jgi:hypothetical protein
MPIRIRGARAAAADHCGQAQHQARRFGLAHQCRGVAVTAAPRLHAKPLLKLAPVLEPVDQHGTKPAGLCGSGLQLATQAAQRFHALPHR